MFALVDANNFFASCERIFRPDLDNKPTIVLSNNDGCIIARSQEVKDLGIPMGAPYFKYKVLCDKHNVEIFSSNYQLYGDISNRLMNSLKLLVSQIEVYSIDEAFLKLDDVEETKLLDLGEKIRKEINTWLRLPISIGIASTKTLAKVANTMAKKANKVIYLKTEEEIDKALEDLKVNEIWGIGKNIAISLNKIGIISAKQLKYTDAKLIRKRFGVIGERIILELRGIPCLELNKEGKAKKNIISSRSFGREVTELKDLEEAVAHYIARGCEKLRKQNSRASGLNVFIRTSKYKSRNEYYYNNSSFQFINPTNDTISIIKEGILLLRNIYKKGYKYSKAGISLLHLVDNDYYQNNLLETPHYNKSDKLMSVIDSINKKQGHNTVFIAAQGIKRDWILKCDRRSQYFTTSWDELLLIN